MGTDRIAEWARRQGCRWAGLHTDVVIGPDDVADEADPCRCEYRCRFCGRLWRAGRSHAYGPYERDRQRCLETRTCRRCGDRTVTSSHNSRRMSVDQVPGPDTWWRQLTFPPRRRTPCEYVWACLDCGDVESLNVESEHVWDDNYRNRRCRICGIAWFIEDDGE